MDGATENTGATPRLGVVGAGRMGSGILQQLATGRWTVGVHDREPGRAAGARSRGQRWFPDLPALARWADVLVTVLPNAAAVQLAMADDVFAACGPGTIWLDCTSGDPDTTRLVADRAAVRGVTAVAAPMGGSPVEAAAGTLQFFVGGPDDAVAVVRPVLEHLAAPGEVRIVGGSPAAAQAVKLSVNALWCVQAVATAEALLVVQRAGVAPDRMRDLLRGTAGSSAFSDRFLSRFLDGDDLASFGTDGLVAELRSVERMSDGLRTPLLDASAALHEDALDRFGPAGGELAAIRLLEEQNGSSLRRGQDARP